MPFTPRFFVQCLCLAALTDGFFVREEDVVKDMDPNCPTVDHYQAEYHMDTACDRAQQNAFKDSLGRHSIQRKLQAMGTNDVPSEQTIFCPQTVNPLTSSSSTSGFDTTWIVENTATTPVVVAYLQEQTDGTYKEVSAFNSKLLANQDPQAIIPPKSWKSVATYEGHIFHVRELLKDGSMGQVLLQHRAGLIGVTNKYGHELNCDPTEPDPEPLVEVAPGEVDRDPDFAREAPRTMRPCNVLDIGFRNEVGCPLNAYYTGMYQMKGVAKPRGNVKGAGYTPKSCHEVFKFHLGLEEKSNNFMFDWNSKTKYEGTYVGHNFVFRYAKDERIVVDSIALHPTRVIDCPGLKNQVNIASHSDGLAILSPMGLREDHKEAPFNIMPPSVILNATSIPTNGTSVTDEWISPSQRRRRAQASVRGANILAQSL